MERERGFFSPRVVQREAVKILAAKGIDVSPGMLRRLVTRFIREGYTTLAEIEPFILCYADPTGETAVRNVLRERA
jgi:hypothetical protein